MDWAAAIKHHSEGLNRIVALLFAMLAESPGERLPEALYRSLLRILRPAESALRRLIVIAARGLVLKPSPSRPFPKGSIARAGTSRPVFQLFDPRKSFDLSGRPRRTRMQPRIHFFGHDPRVAALWAPSPIAASEPKPDDGRVDGKAITRRLQALKAALDDLPHQARRLVRAKLRRAKVPTLKFKSPLRPGRPPGHRKRKDHEVDEILAECHALAWDVWKIDTS